MTRYDHRPRRSRTSLVLFWSLVAQAALVVGFIAAEPLRKSKMEMSRQELEERAAEVEERARERKEREDRERAERRLPDEDKEELVDQEREKREREMRTRVSELQRTKDEMEQRELEELRELSERDLEAVQERLADDIDRRVDELVERARRVNEDSQDQRAQDIEELTRDLAAQNERVQEDPTTSTDELQDLAQRADRLSRELEREQRQARRDEDEAAQERLGDERLTDRYRDTLAEVKGAIDRLAAAAGENLDEGVDEALAAAEAAAAEAGLSEEEIAAMGVEELYDAARELEAAIAEDFADTRAAELAELQNQSYADAREQVSMPMPERAALDGSTTGEQVETVADLNQLRQQLDQVANATQQMQQNAANMLQQTQPPSEQAASQQGSEQLAQALQQSRQARQAVTSAAQMQHPNQTLVDLAPMMRQAMGSSTGGDMSSGRDADAMNNRGGEALAAQEAPTRRVRLNTDRIKAQALPGRQFTRESARQGWLYLDTFYIIGPWEGGRADWSQTHPPEFSIDLDAEYTDGKPENGVPRTLEWQFTQSERMRITPPDEQGGSTYYAYTEVYFEEEMEMLLAIASDDAAKVWINDILVWQDNGLSAWSLDEGFRRVFFQQGFNKILVRIENGPVVCQFSVLLCPPELLGD